MDLHEYESLGIEQGTDFVFRCVTYYFSFNVTGIFKEHSIDVLFKFIKILTMEEFLHFHMGISLSFAFQYATSWSFG